MFYLGSIAGFLPYILAFSLTILWGGHVGKPFFTRDYTTESSIESGQENTPKVEISLQIDSNSQVVEEKLHVFPLYVGTLTALFNFCLIQLFDSAEFGISPLRAPPVSLF